MAATIRLMRFGKKKYPTYRVVVLDKRKKRDGSYIESLGNYNPMMQPAVISINAERYDFWVQRGAILSEGVRKLMLFQKRVVAASKKVAEKPQPAKKKEAVSKAKSPRKKSA